MNFILKVLVASLLLSVAIKYGGPFLDLPPSSMLALGVVLFPSTVMAIALWWRTQTYSP
ncbi:hypothetical protein QPK87_26750 [Kamptonema cortianum]|uniref:Uncharacterized protein n=1 Tax=Geitlerinema calcuttense NRMC-F 0142 TaxID=2922238 RepID=A0ABT7M037_9CYAN|nr:MULTISPECIES: hypothetical protein [Cyanophyceae]MCD8488867.1 hypothetical protein [Desertifilum sp.]MDA0210542.1 hypothetical protein [Cyanobacteria bacterium FC1]MDI9636120.1 hypothetical protein [Geitlerinema splendidum]MDK3160131.1 hypothetical protein [Kamptonema cortianum]MDL5047877.1 hypothetical protein [Oscillatoria amoena NRMC-F 0135]